MGPVLAIDLGGTWLRAAIVGDDGAVVRREAVRTPVSADAPDALVALARTVAAGADLGRAVVGLPGRVDHGLGRLDTAPNLPAGWIEALRADRLSERIGLPVSLANDADLAALGEHGFGAGRGADDVVYVTVSTGVGMGVILGGRLARGRRSIGEFGHTVIDRAAKRAGRACTVEQLGSGTAIVAAAGRVAVEVVHAARGGDLAAKAVLDDAIDALGVGLCNAAYAYSPEVIVVGGGFGRVPEVLAGVAARVAVDGPPGLGVRVVGAALGDDAGLVGAAAWLDAR